MVRGEGGDDVQPDGTDAAADGVGGAPDGFLGEEQTGGAGVGQD